MDFILKFEPKANKHLIQYQHQLMLIGSCFTEHIGSFLKEHKFSVLQNPNGILFDTLSVCRTLTSYIENKQYKDENLFLYNELWQSWQHHSMFSGTNKEMVLEHINASQQSAHHFLKETHFLIITLGSSYAYQLKKETAKEYSIDDFVTNCHKAPQQWFDKYLIPIEEQIANLDKVIYRLKILNPTLQIIFTISPVRHIRDGIVENNRSKARLLETVHHLVDKFNGLHYFPAYEMLIDVLRDYRFYDIDMVHPNYAATSYVMQHFVKACIDNDAQQLLEKIKPLVTAMKHKAFNPESIAHQKFLLQNLDNVKSISKANPFLNFDQEFAFFSNVTI